MKQDTFVEDVKLIAKVDGLKTGLDRPAEKQPIKGKRGIAFINPDGSLGTSTGEKGSALPPDDAQGGPASKETTGGGGGGNTSGTGVTINQDQDGSQTDEDGTKYGTVDASQLFDGTVGVGDSFTGLDFYPCDDPGQKYIIRYDGQFTAPEGWSPDPPPDFELGYYWRGTGSGGAFETPSFSTRSQCHAWAAANLSDVYLFTDGGNLVQYCRSFYGCWAWLREGCSPSEGNPTCPLSASEIVEYWPANSPAQLTWDAERAAFITSPYDTNVASKYKANNVGELHLCDKNGNPIWTAPAKDGGHILTYPANNHFVVIGPDGKVKAAGSGAARDSYVAGGTTLP